MSNAGEALERLTKKGTLSSAGGAYLAAAALVAGPWILMVLGIGVMSEIACGGKDACTPLQIFRSVIIYNFVFSLVGTGPIIFAFTRYVSDKVFAKETGSVMFGLAMAVLCYVLLALLIAAPFYVLGPQLTEAERLLAFFNLMLVGISWLLVPFLGALDASRFVALSYAVGVAAMIGSAQLAPRSSEGLLFAFNLGVAIIDALLLMRLVRNFGAALRPDPQMLAALRSRWELPLIGLVAYLGLWIDKLVMWFAAPTGQSRVAGAFVTLPDYDTAMFWAQLSAIPMLAIFFVHVETGLKALSNRFFTGLERHAGLSQLRDITGEIAKLVFWSLVGLFIAQMAICALSILFSLVAVETLNWRAAQMGILRNALIGVACHTSATFCLSILLFFDLRRPALGLASVFLVLNAALTFVSIQIGFSAYGIGFFVAAAITFLIGLALIHRELSILPYHAFVTNNPSARRKSERGAATAHG